MTLKESTAQGLGWTFIRQSATKAIGFVVFLLMARLLDPRAIGIVTMAKVITGLAGSVLDQGIGKAVVQRQPITEDHLSTGFWASAAAGVGLAVLGMLGAGAAATIYREPELAPVLSWLALGLWIDGLAVIPRSLLAKDLRFRPLALAPLAGELAGGLVGLWMVSAGYGVWALVGQSLARTGLTTIALWAFAQWRPELSFSAARYRELIGFGASVAATRLLRMFSRRLDDFLIGAFLGATALGYYALAFRVLNELGNLLMGTVNLVSFPTFSQIQHQPHRVLRGLYKAVQLTSLAGFPTFAGLAIVAPHIVPVVFGSQWEQSGMVLRILAFTGLLASISILNSSIYWAMGKASWNLGLAALKTVVVLIAFAVAVPYGILAVAGAYVLADLLFFPIELWVMKLLIGLRLPDLLRQVAVPAISAASMTVVVLVSAAILGGAFGGAAGLAVLVPLGVVAYFVAVWALKRSLLADALDFARLMVPTGRSK